MQRLRALLLAGLPALVLTACNTSMVARAAPDVVGSEWVLSAGAEAPALDDGRWRVLAFFEPT